MEKANVLLMLVCFLIFSCDSVSEEGLKSKLNKSLQNYCSALKDFNGEKLVKYAAPSLIDNVGGNEAFKNKLESQKEQFYNNGLSYKKISYLSPLKFKQTDNLIHFLVPIQTKMYAPRNNLTFNRFLYCFSDNYGDTWVIMDYEFLKETYPDFKFEFHPDSEATTNKESCKFVKNNPYGSLVCLDRFIESGEYEAARYKGRNVYKLVRKNHTVKLTEENLKLIKTSVDKWKGDVNKKYQFPQISMKDVVYLESGIREFFPYDIYGIPFSFKSSGTIIYDTLPGYFKSDLESPYYKEENLTKIIDEKYEFEILYETTDF